MRVSRRELLAGALASLAGCGAPRAPSTSTSTSTSAAPAVGPVPGSARAARSVVAPRPGAETTSAASPAPAPASPAPTPALALVRAFPALAPHLPHLSLGTLPTPVERAPHLGNALGIASLWIKRDDLTGARYGGGKTRKLELFLAEARARGARTVITFGGVGSNQAVATAIYATEQGMKPVLLLLPGPADARVRAQLLAALHAGADIHVSPAPARAEAAARRIALRDHDDPAPYLVPAGGSTLLGNAAFVSAAFELRAQIDAGLLPVPDVVYVALGTMGSAAGLAVGLNAAGVRCELVAVRASNPGTSTAAGFQAAMTTTSDLLRAADPSFPAPASASPPRIEARQLGAGYGLSTPAGLEAMRLARAFAALELEPVYTAKALAAIGADARHLDGKVVLFWNTHSSRPLELGDADWRRLPRALHGYFATGR